MSRVGIYLTARVLLDVYSMNRPVIDNGSGATRKSMSRQTFRVPFGGPKQRRLAA